MINTTAKRASLAFLLAVLVTLVALPLAAGAQEADDPYTTNPTDPPTSDVADTSVVNDTGTEVAGEQVSSNTLPFTGGDAAVLAAIGVGLVVAGAVLVVTRRRRSDSLA
ncbi:MAG: LPXTG cell wall anchor domain-containing protein [Acidimicrobiia bacterium]|nr:LPXTG cell wall anchor domain-containing protein [Acidimicrobiia bacterium]